MPEPKLRHGPGLILRWSLAVLLLLIAYLVPIMGLVILKAWAQDTAFAAAVPTLHTSSFSFTLKDVLAELTEAGRIAWIWLLAAVALFIGNRYRASIWWKVSFLFTLPFAIPVLLTAVTGLFGSKRVPGWQGLVVRQLWLISLLVVVTSAIIAWLAGRIVSLPLAQDLARSSLEVIVPLRTGGQLLIQRDRLVVRGVGGNDDLNLGALGMSLTRLEFLQTGTFATASESTDWRLPNGTVVALDPGPTLRFVGANQQWLLPVAEPEKVAELIASRARSLPVKVKRRLEQLENAHQNVWAQQRRQLANERQDQTKRALRTPISGFTASWLVGGILMMMLAVLALPGIAPVKDWSPWYLITTVLFGIFGIACVRRWITVTRMIHFLENNPREPQAPVWGEVDPSSSPLAGWSANSSLDELFITNTP